MIDPVLEGCRRDQELGAGETGMSGDGTRGGSSQEQGIRMNVSPEGREKKQDEGRPLARP